MKLKTILFLSIGLHACDPTACSIGPKTSHEHYYRLGDIAYISKKEGTFQATRVILNYYDSIYLRTFDNEFPSTSYLNVYFDSLKIDTGISTSTFESYSLDQFKEFKPYFEKRGTQTSFDQSLHDSLLWAFEPDKQRERIGLPPASSKGDSLQTDSVGI